MMFETTIFGNTYLFTVCGECKYGDRDGWEVKVEKSIEGGNAFLLHKMLFVSGEPTELNIINQFEDYLLKDEDI